MEIYIGIQFSNLAFLFSIFIGIYFCNLKLVLMLVIVLSVVGKFYDAEQMEIAKSKAEGELYFKLGGHTKDEILMECGV